MVDVTRAQACMQMHLKGQMNCWYSFSYNLALPAFASPSMSVLLSSLVEPGLSRPALTACMPYLAWLQLQAPFAKQWLLDGTKSHLVAAFMSRACPPQMHHRLGFRSECQLDHSCWQWPCIVRSSEGGLVLGQRHSPCLLQDMSDLTCNDCNLKLFFLADESGSILTIALIPAQASVNDFIVRAAALALEQVPEANAMWDAKTGEIKPASSIDVAIAVATDGGLITPIVKQANTKTLQQISGEVSQPPAFHLPSSSCLPSQPLSSGDTADALKRQPSVLVSESGVPGYLQPWHCFGIHSALTLMTCQKPILVSAKSP